MEEVRWLVFIMVPTATASQKRSSIKGDEFAEI
jgi:hypothetical protein